MIQQQQNNRLMTDSSPATREWSKLILLAKSSPYILLLSEHKMYFSRKEVSKGAKIRNR